MRALSLALLAAAIIALAGCEPCAVVLGGKCLSRGQDQDEQQDPFNTPPVSPPPPMFRPRG